MQKLLAKCPDKAPAHAPTLFPSTAPAHAPQPCPYTAPAHAPQPWFCTAPAHDPAPAHENGSSFYDFFPVGENAFIGNF